VVVDALADRLAHRHGGGEVVLGQDERELLAAVPGAEGPVGQVGAEQRDEPLQHPVAEQVPERVVDLLEVVGVHDRDGQARPGGRGVDQGEQPLVEVAAVPGRGEPVAARQLAASACSRRRRPARRRGVPAQQLHRRAQVGVGLLPAAARGQLLGRGRVPGHRRRRRPPSSCP
jgi:hypothetical protein